MKKVLLLSLLVPALSWGQASFGHLDTIELGKMQTARHNAPSKGDDAGLTFFVRVSDDATVERVAAAGATIDQREGNILIVTAPFDRAEAVAAVDGVVSVSLPRELTVNEWLSPYGRDLSRKTLGLDKIQAGAEPFSKAYTGEGVIVGVIDMGIDVHHISFLNPDGTHRVKRAWKHVQSGKAVATLTSDTEEKMVRFSTDNSSATHGTHVMGIAAGGFVAPGGNGPDFRGGAPEADIAVSCGVADTPRLIKGLRSIIDYAAAEGKPCVVNISMGNNVGPHDGTDEFPAALNELAGKDGVTVCISAGNEGADNAFLYHEFEEGAETLKTIINPTEYTAAIWPGISLLPQAIGTMEIWSDDATPFTVHVDVVKYDGHTPKVVSTFTLPETGSGYLCTQGAAPVKPDVICDDNEEFESAYKFSFIGGASEVYAPNNRYHAELALQLECTDKDTYQSCRMALRIEGKPGHKVYVYGAPLSGAFGYCFIGSTEGHVASVADGSINAMAGAANVITVGSYVTHNMTVAKDVIGTTANYSSWGHTPDGRVHPLVSAPGSRIISSMSSNYVDGPAYDPDQLSYYSYKSDSGVTYHWTPMSGTSMASPFMTGVAAMWLSADPTLTTEEIVNIAQTTARKPTETRPNDGMGAHIDAYAGLCKILGLSGVGNVTVDGTAIFDVARDGNIFTVRSSASRSLAARIYNLQGAELCSASTAGSDITLDASTFAAGVYVLTVEADGAASSRKIIVQ